MKRYRMRYTVPMASWVTGLRQVHRALPFDVVHAQHYGGATRAHFACRLFGWPMVYGAGVAALMWVVIARLIIEPWVGKPLPLWWPAALAAESMA